MKLMLYGAQHGPRACRFCGASIVWALTDHDRRLPVDVAPVASGTWVLWYSPEEEPEAVQRASYFRTTTDAGTPLRWVSHWATCTEREAARHLAERHRVERPERGVQLDLFSGGGVRR